MVNLKVTTGVFVAKCEFSFSENGFPILLVTIWPSEHLIESVITQTQQYQATWMHKIEIWAEKNLTSKFFVKPSAPPPPLCARYWSWPPLAFDTIFISGIYSSDLPSTYVQWSTWRHDSRLSYIWTWISRCQQTLGREFLMLGSKGMHKPLRQCCVTRCWRNSTRMVLKGQSENNK